MDDLKLVRLVDSETDLTLSRSLIRKAAIALANWACNGSIGRIKGDPVFEMITEGRQKSWMSNGKETTYSSCGDLPHFVIWNLAGKPDPGSIPIGDQLRVVNRHEAFGYQVGKNISLLSNVASRNTIQTSLPNLVPLPGSILLMGSGGNEHVCIVNTYTESELTSFDYGQFVSVDSKEAATNGGCAVTRGIILDKYKNLWATRQGHPSKLLILYVDLGEFISTTCLVNTLSYVPNSFEGGITSDNDNPY